MYPNSICSASVVPDISAWLASRRVLTHIVVSCHILTCRDMICCQCPPTSLDIQTQHPPTSLDIQSIRGEPALGTSSHILGTSMTSRIPRCDPYLYPRSPIPMSQPHLGTSCIPGCVTSAGYPGGERHICPYPARHPGHLAAPRPETWMTHKM